MMLNTTPLLTPTPLLQAMRLAYRADETSCVTALLAQAELSPAMRDRIAVKAQELVTKARAYQKHKRSRIDALLHQYKLSSDEGIVLMCLAEALLRIPDKKTVDQLIADKLATVDWKNHLSAEKSLFTNAMTWSLLLTGKMYAPTLESEQNVYTTLKKTFSRLGTHLVRPIIINMMKTMGKQFVLGQSIQAAIKNARPLEKIGYLYSYDMLGEAARTAQEAQLYFQAYETAITSIGESAVTNQPSKNSGISIKLSALHPRYEYTKKERVLRELPPLLLKLAQLAKRYHLGLTVDAEEADRLELSLEIFERVYSDASLNDWDGLGIAVQAYQKRAPLVIDWLLDLANNHHKRMMIRLVKGAYWDAEIKSTQVQGFSDYPVFTRKNSSDVSYLACAKKLLAAPTLCYPQFGTHNAHTVASIMLMAEGQHDFEFQCLHGMGRALYDQVVAANRHTGPTCRIYAPVGSHQHLLGYLVRRLLENGANNSFINRLADDHIPIAEIIADPVARIAALPHKPHPHIPRPKDIYAAWQNSAGLDLSDPDQLERLQAAMQTADAHDWNAASIINGHLLVNENALPIIAPSNQQKIVGYFSNASDEDIQAALAQSSAGFKSWSQIPVAKRAAIMECAATLFEEALPTLVTLLTREAGKCLLDCLSEVRETIDYCRYYAYRARLDLEPVMLPGPTGETNELSLHPRGVMICISPWNFPLAIFCGQIMAALLAGNAVIAKPAEQTPLIACHAVQILHRAGVPAQALQLLIGEGKTVGAQLVSDARIAGVMFTGSTETAKTIERSLAAKSGPISLLIAETGGQNAMIVDSSALIEQAVVDIAQSAFNSAGQRCSALRVLFVQDDIADALLNMLSGYMQQLTVGDPALLASDIGPVIDKKALTMLEQHFAKMNLTGKLLAQTPLCDTLDGTYFAPCVFALNDLSVLTREVFGPILHVLRYHADQLEQVLKTIENMGYGLTLGIHSRIETTIQAITKNLPIGNRYVNRNMIGAVVGVQPFGGERLSGTGPKAGGPHYLPRLCVERSLSINTSAVGGNARLVSLIEE